MGQEGSEIFDSGIGLFGIARPGGFFQEITMLIPGLKMDIWWNVDQIAPHIIQMVFYRIKHIWEMIMYLFAECPPGRIFIKDYRYRLTRKSCDAPYLPQQVNRRYVFNPCNGYPTTDIYGQRYLKPCNRTYFMTYETVSQHVSAVRKGASFVKLPDDFQCTDIIR